MPIANIVYQHLNNNKGYDKATQQQQQQQALWLMMLKKMLLEVQKTPLWVKHRDDKQATIAAACGIRWLQDAIVGATYATNRLSEDACKCNWLSNNKQVNHCSCLWHKMIDKTIEDLQFAVEAKMPLMVQQQVSNKIVCKWLNYNKKKERQKGPQTH